MDCLYSGRGLAWKGPLSQRPMQQCFIVQMSHGPAGSCSRIALKSLMGERKEGRGRQRVCVGVWERAINSARLSFCALAWVHETIDGLCQSVVSQARILYRNHLQMFFVKLRHNQTEHGSFQTRQIDVSTYNVWSGHGCNSLNCESCMLVNTVVPPSVNIVRNICPLVEECCVTVTVTWGLWLVSHWLSVRFTYMIAKE